MDAHLAGSSSRRIAESLSRSASRRHGSGKFSVEETTTPVDRRKYPIRADGYVLYEEVGKGVSASVYRALCCPLNEIVAIKILDFERSNSDLSNISREAQTMLLVDHPHILSAYCSFVNDQSLWLVMPYMAGGSCLHILKAAYPDGFEETIIATVLEQALRGLLYLHHHGLIHRDVKAGNILMDAHGGVKLGDFGVSASLFDSGDRQRARNTFVGTPCWMAPEVMDPKRGYDSKADIWSFGITALELAHGHAPFSKYPPMKVLLMTLQNAPPGLDYERDKKFSKSFKQMIAGCLVKDPSRRPTAHQLARHPFFRQARSSDYIARTILDGLPELGERLKELKLKDENLVAQKKMPDGKKEELSLSEYKRGISGWDFNMENLKAQASLIQDIVESIPDNEQRESSESLFGLGMIPDKESQHHLQTSLEVDVMENEDEDEKKNNPIAPLSPGSAANDLKVGCCGIEEESSNAMQTQKSLSEQDIVVPYLNGNASCSDENLLEVDDMNSKRTGFQHSNENCPPGPDTELASVATLCKIESSKQHSQTQAAGITKCAKDLLSETLEKGATLTVLNSDANKKPKGLVDSDDKSRRLDANEKPKGPDASEKPMGPDASEKPMGPYASEKPKGIDAGEKPVGIDASEKPKGPDASEKPKGPDASEKPKGPDASDKLKGPVVHQRGRFKVTSESVEKDKASPSALQKSHSMQVIAQHPGFGSSAADAPLSNHIGGALTPQLQTTSAADAPLSNHIGGALTPQLHTMFQSINSLRENFVILMKQVSNGQMFGGDLLAARPADGVSTPQFTLSTEGLWQAAAMDREKELLQEITDLNWRLVCAQVELQKLRAKSSQV